MNSSALIMLIVSIVLVWGGLVAALVHLARHPEEEEGQPADRQAQASHRS